jgi:hypothetical protein
MRSLVSTTLFLLLTATADPAQSQSWDPGPLKTPTPIPNDGLPSERRAFFAWLGSNPSTKSEVDVQRARERVYAYISQLAKRYGGFFPASSDTEAISLFTSAANLGITGPDMVVRALAPHSTAPSSTPSPEGLSLNFHPPLYSLSSSDGNWAVCFPYYFMPAPLGRQQPANGVATELAVISTLFAADQGSSGASQATIMIAAAPTADSAKHVALWLGQLGVAPAPLTGPSDLGQWYTAPSQEPMRREAVVRRLPDRIVLVAYIGLPGTFEANRPHFLDLLRTLSPRHCAA